MNTFFDDRPLARSLLPLPDEGLFGFLLRLGHRLDESPLQLGKRIGLGRSRSTQIASTIPSRFILQLDDFRLESFARATRLGTETVDALTLRPLARHYPPLAEALTPIGRRIALPHWLRIESTRYCPSCLAGDGSAIQNRHGGPWKRRWHLPVVFACLDHDTYLRAVCPTCGHRPLHCTPSTSWTLPSQGSSHLHPAQCRQDLDNWARDSCGARLDEPVGNPDMPPLDPAIATLQQDLLDRLESTADPATSSEFFGNLSVLAAIISAAWPNHPELPAPAELLDAFNAHAEEQSALLPHGKRTPGRRSPTGWTALPKSAPATAALLVMASHCLRLSDPDLREQLAELLARVPGRYYADWGGIFDWTQTGHCPTSFRFEIQDGTDDIVEAA
jgi:hypothetical protein